MKDGEIVGFRQVHDNPPEVLVRKVTIVCRLMPCLGSDPDTPVEFERVPEYSTEWRPATELDLEILRLQGT